MDQYEWLSLKLSLEKVQSLLKVNSLEKIQELTIYMKFIINCLPSHVVTFEIPLPENEGYTFSVSKTPAISYSIWDMTDVMLRLETTEAQD